MSDESVWIVYDKLRTACLNVKYYECRLQTFERYNIAIDFILLASAPSSAIAGLWFWDTEYGSIIWKCFGIIAAIASIIKPLGSFPKKIKEYGSLVSGYRILYYDLSEIKRSIEEKHTYNQSMRSEFNKAMKRERSLVITNPETKENNSVKEKCEAEVRRKYPPEHFYIPGENNA